MANSNRSAEREAFWRLAVEEQVASGLTARAFCQREGLSEPSFYAWRRKLRLRDTQTEAREQAMVPVDIVDPIDGSTDRVDEPATPATHVEPSSQVLEVEIPGGFILRFRGGGFEVQRIDALLGVIVSRSQTGVEAC